MVKPPPRQSPFQQSAAQQSAAQQPAAQQSAAQQSAAQQPAAQQAFENTGQAPGSPPAERRRADRRQADRQQWMAALAKAPLPKLDELVANVDVPMYRFLRSPETGLTMVRARAGGVGQVFNLGEMTLTRCVVQLFDYSSSVAGQPQPIAGFGYVAGRSHRHAELAAVCDGLLQHRDWHQLMTLEVLEPLGAIAKEENAQKQQRTAATKVDFFTMMRGE